MHLLEVNNYLTNKKGKQKIKKRRNKTFVYSQSSAMKSNKWHASKRSKPSSHFLLGSQITSSKYPASNIPRAHVCTVCIATLWQCLPLLRDYTRVWIRQLTLHVRYTFFCRFLCIFVCLSTSTRMRPFERRRRALVWFVLLLVFEHELGTQSSELGARDTGHGLYSNNRKRAVATAVLKFFTSLYFVSVNAFCAIWEKREFKWSFSLCLTVAFKFYTQRIKMF